MLILLAVPMALVGACWGLSLTRNPLSFMSFLGMISLTGIAVNDSIVLVDTVNRLREQGADLEDAVVTGARTRLRAVLLTLITTIGGLLPLYHTLRELHPHRGHQLDALRNAGRTRTDRERHARARLAQGPLSRAYLGSAAAASAAR